MQPLCVLEYLHKAGERSRVEGREARLDLPKVPAEKGGAEGWQGRIKKKPVVVEAGQWTGENHAEMCEFIDPEVFEIKPKEGLIIHTLEGDHHASPGDYIIKGVNGEFYPCKPDIFAKTYEPATLTPPNEWVSVEERLPPLRKNVLVCAYWHEHWGVYMG